MKRNFKTKKRDNDRLRLQIDGDDQFFQGSDIRTPRDGGREPEPWMLDRAALKDFLLKRFPRADQHCEWCRENGGCSGPEGFMCEHHDYHCLCRSCCQFSSAGMWTFAIQCCFRMGQSAEAAASYWNEEHENCKPVNADYFRRVIQQIELARQGRRLDGKPRSHGKPGRPRKNKLTPLSSAS